MALGTRNHGGILMRPVLIHLPSKSSASVSPQANQSGLADRNRIDGGADTLVRASMELQGASSVPSHRRSIRLTLFLGYFLLAVLTSPRTPSAQTLNATATNIDLDWVTPPPQEIAQALTKICNSRIVAGSQPEVTKTLKRTLDILIASGYRRVIVAPRDFTLKGDTLSCTFRITLGPRAYVIAQEFAGLSHTDTTWLRHLTSMPLDTPLTATWLSLAQERLRSISCLRLAGSPEIIPAISGGSNNEPVTVRWHLAESRPVLLDGMVAAGGQSTGGLNGRASIRMAGLLRRNRSVSLDYQRLQLASTQLRITLAESGAFGKPFDWGLTLDDSRQDYQRQGIAASLRYGVGPFTHWRVETQAKWRKVTPGSLPVAPSRTTEFALGLSHQSRGNAPDELYGSPTRTGLTAAYSRRHQFASATPASGEAIDDRMMLSWEINKTISVSQSLSCHWSASGQRWLSGVDRLGAGDEWYLGGDRQLRGYADREIVARSGAWTSLEFSNRLGTSAAISVFAEAASLQMFDRADANRRVLGPYDYGIALWLLSPDRIGHLEFAWRDHAAWRDGLVRLRVSQSW